MQKHYSLTRWVNNHYGGKKPFLLFFYNKIQGHLGRFSLAEEINWTEVGRLVFVCRGNICRSPYAEAIARKCGLESASIGLMTKTGKPADSEAIKNAAIRGIDLSEHKATSIEDFDFIQNDLLVTVEPWQLEKTRQQVIMPDVYHTLLGIWADGYYPYLPDPYGKSDAFYQRCFFMIESGVNNIGSNIFSNIKAHQ